MKKIKSISEAFSMQPVSLSVVDKPSHIKPEDSIAKIELEVLDDYNNIYVGYNFEGERKFEYLQKAVNVHYF